MSNVLGFHLPQKTVNVIGLFWPTNVFKKEMFVKYLKPYQQFQSLEAGYVNRFNKNINKVLKNHSKVFQAPGLVLISWFRL